MSKMIELVILLILALFIGFPIYTLLRLNSLSGRIKRLESGGLKDSHIEPEKSDVGSDDDNEEEMDGSIIGDIDIGDTDDEDKKADRSDKEVGSGFSFNLFKVFGGIGVLMILLGIVFFYMYAVDNGWIGILGRVAIGIMSSSILILIGVILNKKKYDKFSQLIIGLGLGLMYFTVYATYFFKEYREALSMTLLSNVVLSLIVFLGGMMIGAKLNKRFIVYLSFGIGFLASIITLFSSSGDAYYAFYNILIVGLSMFFLDLMKKWNLGVYSQVATYITYSIMFYKYFYELAYKYNISKNLPLSFIILAYLFVPYLLYYIYSLKDKHAVIMSVVNSVAAGAFGLWFFYFGTYYDFRGVFLILLAGLTLLCGKMYNKLSDAQDNGSDEANRKKMVMRAQFVLSVIMVGTSIPVQFDYAIVSMVWVLIVLGLLYLGNKTNEKYISILGVIGMIFPYVRVITFDMWQNPLINRAIPMLSVLIGTYFMGRMVDKESLMQKIYNLWSLFLLVLWIGVEADNYIRDNHSMHVVISISWALLSIFIITYGLYNKRKYLNWEGIILFVIVLIKVLLVDLSYLDDIMRVLVLIAVGLLALIASFVFVKNKEKIKEEFL